MSKDEENSEYYYASKKGCRIKWEEGTLIKKQYLLGITFVLVIACGIGIHGYKSNEPFVSVNDSDQENGLKIVTLEEIRKGGYPINEFGETYGPNIPENAEATDEPDLILVENSNGKYGYIKASDLNQEPHTIKEALAYSNVDVRVLNMYSQDGKTIIVRFEIGK